MSNALQAVLSSAKQYRMGSLFILVGHEETEHGMRWHLSISHPTSYPKWDEIKEARMRYVPHSVTMAMFLPGEQSYVNIHPNCFHLWETKET